MWNNGLDQFLPFVFTVVAIVFTDLLTGVGIGLFTSVIFILRSNLQRPLDIIEEKLPSGTIFRFVLANQVSFLNRASFSMALGKMPQGSQVVFDGSATKYIDLDMVDLIQDFKEQSAPARNITVSLLGFKPNYQLENEINYTDHATFELQRRLNPQQILQILKDGNERVLKGRRFHRDINRQISATADAQFPLAVVLSCMDSRTPVELIFDLGIGDIFSIRMAGNVISGKVLGSLEFACVTAGAKLIIVMGHTRCGAVKAAIDAKVDFNSPHLNSVILDIKKVLHEKNTIPIIGTKARADFEEQVVHKNVINSLNGIYYQNQVLKNLINLGSIQMVGCVYDVQTGKANFIDSPLEEFRIRQDLLPGFQIL
jgi:carbonic anhydrase/SulP family sulfate permease